VLPRYDSTSAGSVMSSTEWRLEDEIEAELWEWSVVLAELQDEINNDEQEAAA
jgi:hypothetical protein